MRGGGVDAATLTALFFFCSHHFPCFVAWFNSQKEQKKNSKAMTMRIWALGQKLDKLVQRRGREVCLYIYIYIYYIYIYMCVCVCVCVYIYIYIYIYMTRRRGGVGLGLVRVYLFAARDRRLGCGPTC